MSDADAKNATRPERCAMWQRRCQRFPDSREAHNMAGHLLGTMGRFEEAIPYFERAIELDRGNCEDCLNLGFALHKLGRLDPAVAWLRESVKRNPRYASGWTELGSVLFDRGAAAEALHAYDQAIAAKQNSPGAWELKGVALRRMGQEVPARSCFGFAAFLTGDASMQSRAARLEFWQKRAAAFPKDGEAWIEAAKVLEDMQRMPEALAALDGALAADERNELALYYRGLLLHQMGRVEESLEALRRAERADPTKARAWVKEGSILKAMGKPKEAEQAFRAAVHIEFNVPDAWLGLGAIFEKEKRWPEATEAYRAAVDLVPYNATALYGAGLAQARDKDWAGALALYDRALGYAPRATGVRRSRIMALRNVGRVDEAVAAARELGMGPPPDPPTLYLLAKLLESTGKRDEALWACDYLTKIAPKDPSGAKLKAAILDGTALKGWTDTAE